MTVLTNSGKKSTGLGARIIAHLAKHGSATAEQIAEALKAPRRDVSARCWWLHVKEGRLTAWTEGEEKRYSLPPAAEPEPKPEPRKVKSKTKAKAKPAKRAASKRGAK